MAIFNSYVSLPEGTHAPTNGISTNTCWWNGDTSEKHLFPLADLQVTFSRRVHQTCFVFHSIPQGEPHHSTCPICRNVFKAGPRLWAALHRPPPRSGGQLRCRRRRRDPRVLRVCQLGRGVFPRNGGPMSDLGKDILYFQAKKERCSPMIEDRGSIVEAIFGLFESGRGYKGQSPRARWWFWNSQNSETAPFANLM